MYLLHVYTVDVHEVHLLIDPCVQLVDIQPSKTGGFKAAVPTKLPVIPTASDPPPIIRKKVRLSESGGRENRSPAAHKKIKSFSRRKRYTPHKTPDEILQNIVVSQNNLSLIYNYLSLGSAMNLILVCVSICM